MLPRTTAAFLCSESKTSRRAKGRGVSSGRGQSQFPVQVRRVPVDMPAERKLGLPRGADSPGGWRVHSGHLVAGI